MNTQKEWFDVETSPSEQNEVSPAIQEQTKKSLTSTLFLGLGIREGVILATFIVLGGMYLFWPSPSTSQEGGHFSYSLSINENAVGLKKDSAEQGALPLSSNPQNHEAVSSTLSALTQFKKDMAFILETHRLSYEENREAIKMLSARLEAKNKDLQQLEQQLKDMAKRFEPHHTQKALTDNKKRFKPDQKKQKTASGTTGYRLHALFKGMAWITYKGSTYALQEGDSLGKLRINKIDTTKHQIETSAGVIR